MRGGANSPVRIGASFGGDGHESILNGQDCEGVRRFGRSRGIRRNEAMNHEGTRMHANGNIRQSRTTAAGVSIGPIHFKVGDMNAQSRSMRTCLVSKSPIDSDAGALDARNVIAR
jgi:hypothetical protein